MGERWKEVEGKTDISRAMPRRQFSSDAADGMGERKMRAKTREGERERRRKRKKCGESV